MKKLFPILLGVSLIFRLVLSPLVYSGDLNNHVGWAQSILRQGFAGAYDREYQGIMQPTYPPLSLYAFTTSTGLYNLIYKTSWYLNSHFSLFPSKFIWLLQDQDVLPAFNKVITIISDIGIGVLVYSFVRYLKPKSKVLALFSATAFLLNPAVWYTSSLWGQIESFSTFWLLLAFWYIYRKNPIFAHLAFVAALLSKQSTIIFIPFFSIYFIRRFNIQKYIEGVIIQIFTFMICYLPFLNSVDLLWPFKVYINRIQTGSGSNWITDHAFNVWVWISHLEKIPDSRFVLPFLSANIVGTALFAVPIALLVLGLWHKPTIKKAILTNAVIPMLAFLLLTKMHERYYAPVLPFLAIGAAFTWWLWPIYFAVSLAHFLNLYHNWWFPWIPNLVTWVSLPSSINLIIVTFIVGLVVSTFAYVKRS